MGILLEIAYDGSNYSGWQVQNNKQTIQGVLKNVIQNIYGECDLLGASRTDAGVHALGQVAHLKTQNLGLIPMERLPYALNSHLPKDIVVHSARLVSDNFHPIADAKSKIYTYKILNSKFLNPIFRNYIHFEPRELNINKMREQAQHFLGEHDFAAFCAANSSAKSTVRHIFSLDITQETEIICINICGNGFLYNMVRIIAGTLVEVGLGRIDDVKSIINSKNRHLAGKTLPAKGLVLQKIFY